MIGTFMVHAGRAYVGRGMAVMLSQCTASHHLLRHRLVPPLVVHGHLESYLLGKGENGEGGWYVWFPHHDSGILRLISMWLYSNQDFTAVIIALISASVLFLLYSVCFIILSSVTRCLLKNRYVVHMVWDCETDCIQGRYKKYI